MASAQASLTRANKRAREAADNEEAEKLRFERYKSSRLEARVESVEQKNGELKQQLEEVEKKLAEKEQQRAHEAQAAEKKLEETEKKLEEAQKKIEEENEAKEANAKKEAETKKAAEDKKLVAVMRTGAMTDSGDKLFRLLTTPEQVALLDDMNSKLKAVTIQKRKAENRSESREEDNQLLKGSINATKIKNFEKECFGINKRDCFPHAHEAAALAILNLPYVKSKAWCFRLLNDAVKRKDTKELKNIFYINEKISTMYIEHYEAALTNAS